MEKQTNKKIPCSCPKGGLYERENGSTYTCDKCGGSEWVDPPTNKEERKGHPKECKGDFHDGQNGTWKCWECGMIGGGFNNAPEQNKPTLTCLNMHCPERTGGKCNADENKSIEDVVEEFKENFPTGEQVIKKSGESWDFTDYFDEKLTSLVQQSKEEVKKNIREIITLTDWENDSATGVEKLITLSKTT